MIMALSLRCLGLLQNNIGGEGNRCGYRQYWDMITILKLGDEYVRIH